MPDRDILKPHSFDGIQEYDNNLPRWWLAILWLSVAWAVCYIGYYHVEGAKLGEEAMRAEIAAANEARLKNSAGPLDEDLLRQLSHDAARIAKGRQLFTGGVCITCHGPEGNGKLQGGIDGPGPNLRDAYWLHGSDMTAIIATITHGVIDRGMPANQGLIGEDDIISLACFIADQARKPIAGRPHDPQRDQEQAIAW